ncbi:uncharacterized protein TNCV_1336401 [Trichonephila clavipes]|nr:uncharacterized protein TNCV_1336401 [Trichonephila clavipes]
MSSLLCGKKNKLGESSAKFSIWYEGHKSECDINHLCSSTSMGMEAAFTLWKRSTSLGFRYITVLSDGNCKTFSYLCQKGVYGPDIEIKKEECINHVSKRLGTALRSTVKDCRAQGFSLGVNGDRYRAMITNFFIPELNNHDVQELWFQQDGATCHTARATIDLLKDTFGDRLISRFGPVNWPPRSCDLTPLDYFL